MKTRISIVRPDLIPVLWPEIWPHLKPAIEEDLFTDEATLKKDLMEDKSLMFLALEGESIKGACVVKVAEEKNDIVNIITIGGEDFKEWKEAMNAALTEYAQLWRCKYILAIGRKGWEKLWPDFTAGAVMFYKEVKAAA